MSIRIILVDDHGILRSGLRNLLEKHEDMEVIAEAEDGRAAVRLVAELSPDVVVIDVSMPNLNGIEATRQIVSASCKVKVIALSMHSDEQFVAGMLEAGACGYLLKGCNFEELTSAIRAAAAGKAYLSPGVCNLVIGSYLNRGAETSARSASPLLTAREREVLQLLAEGKSTREIASQLYVSIKTAEAHRQHIMNKLNLHSIAELTKYAIREGLTSL